jgi:Delta6-protoilludene synthase
VTSVMQHRSTDLQGAMDWLGEYHNGLAQTFMDTYSDLPDWELQWGKDVKEEIESYVDGLGNWVRANNQWSFETARYFGEKGSEVQETRRVELLPISIPSEVGPQLVKDIMLSTIDVCA